MTDRSRNAYPERQYDGNPVGYEEYMTDKETWLTIAVRDLEVVSRCPLCPKPVRM